MVTAHDYVCFNEARDCLEDALCTVGLLLTPEGKAFGEVLVARYFFEHRI